MTTEQKAQAYDEALKRAKDWTTEREQLICPREIVEFLYRYTKYGIPNDIGTPHFRDIINAQWCYCNDLIP